MRQPSADFALELWVRQRQRRLTTIAAEPSRTSMAISIARHDLDDIARRAAATA